MERSSFETFEEAYLNIVEEIVKSGSWVEGVKDPNSIGSGFGKNQTRTKEILVYTFAVSNPRCRTLNLNNKSINSPYLMANFLWSLMGTRQGEFIIPFNRNGSFFLDSQSELNAAIGPHIFKQRNNIYSELNEVEKLLKRDPTTRRAVFQFFLQTDVTSGSKDIPCYNHIQFFIRDGKLHSHVVMRSQNALMVLPYDFFYFSLLHEAMSVRLRADLGTMYYTANSMHIYEDKLPIAKSLSKSDGIKTDFRVMTDFSDQTIDTLSRVFKMIAHLWGERKFDVISNIIEQNVKNLYWKKSLNEHFLTDLE